MYEKIFHDNIKCQSFFIPVFWIDILHGYQLRHLKVRERITKRKRQKHKEKKRERERENLDRGEKIEKYFTDSKIFGSLRTLFLSLSVEKILEFKTIFILIHSLRFIVIYFFSFFFPFSLSLPLSLSLSLLRYKLGISL